MNNIQVVQNMDMCSGCGSCVIACPPKIIDMQVTDIHRPLVCEEDCINCGRCLDVCPNYKWNFEELSFKPLDKYFNSDIYVGYSNDSEIRMKSSSGGICTTVIKALMEQNIVDGAIVSYFDTEHMVGYPKIIYSVAELMKSSKSKYCSIPVNTILDELEEGKRYVYVGLPCHIVGLKEISKINKKVNESIVLTVGLMCGHIPTYDGIKDIIKKNNKTFGLQNLQFREEGWGVSLLDSKVDGDEIINKDYWSTYFNNYLYSVKSCIKCRNFFAEGADIVLGDAWELKSHKDYCGKGANLILAMSEEGNLILRKLSKNRQITIETSSSRLLFSSTKGNIYLKYFSSIRSEKLRIRLIRACFRGIYMFNYELVRRKKGRKFIMNCPDSIIKVSMKCVNFTKKVLIKLDTEFQAYGD
ncbi:Coenzyme F420 hydrogenase/dehydrogenase, beta subunit C-terminal domain [Fusibacter sp. JL216-2]|uniref:Coenzyme F420 hydrogenase/dehydrogenase, beta subunit C-terminal domain n=1 Tax=Fusibacter sp. JL216-2 TaxID=3071453 RepID=UPI003D331B04